MNCLMPLRLMFGLLLVSFTTNALCSPKTNDMPDKLRAGVMLYSLYKGDYLDALIFAPDTPSEEKQLYLAEAMTQFGLVNGAKQRYKELVSNGSAATKAGALFQLGKMSYSSGDWQATLKLLKQSERGIKGSLLSELRYYQANAYIKLEKYGKAAAVLGKMKEGGWAAYAYYNLAMAYAEIDSDPARSIISLRVAEALNSNDTAALIELRDKTLLAAGYLSVQADDYQKAVSFLNKVRVDSDLAPKALYMHGVANSNQEQYRSAIQSWYRVKKYPLINPGVSEAFLAIPFGYDKEGYSSKAISSYLEAISVFDKETRNIDKVISTIKKNGVRKAFFEKSSLDDLEWFLSDSVATNTPKVAYLKHIMGDPGLHQLAKESLELESLYQNLILWENNLTVYIDMLDERISGYYRRVKTAGVSNKKTKIKVIAQQAQSLKDKLENAVGRNDFVKVSAGTTLGRFDAVNGLDKRLKALSSKIDTRQYKDLKQRLERLEGLVKWEAKEQYERNVRLSKESLLSLDREIERYQQSLTKFEGMVTKGPSALEAFKRRSSEMMRQVKEKKNAVSVMRQEQNELLSSKVLDLLAVKKSEFVAFHQKAQQRLAHLYEYVAMKQDARTVKATLGGQQ